MCEGGELLDRILTRDGRYSEEDAKVIVTQILSVVAFCYLLGVVHRDLMPENFLFTSKNEDADMRLLDGFIINTLGALCPCPCPIWCNSFNDLVFWCHSWSVICSIVWAEGPCLEEC